MKSILSTQFAVLALFFPFLLASPIDRLESFQECLYSSGVDAKNIVIRGESPKYTLLNHQWQENDGEIFPQAYVVVQNEHDIQSAVKCGRLENIHLVAKAGGHSFTKFSFGDSNSVIVDLRDIRYVHVEGETVKVGAGTPMGLLIWNLYQSRRFFPAGFCPNVGISGLVTGGGLGLFTRQHGLPLDFLLEAKVVTADGNLITANETHHSDMFWALRGGGAASFGIVTSFTFRTLPIPSKFLIGTLTFEKSEFTQVYAAFQDFVLNGPRSVQLLIGFKGPIRAVFIEAFGDVDVFQAVTAQFPTPLSSTYEVFDYIEGIFYAAQKLSGQSFVEGTKFDVPEDMAHLTPETSGKENFRSKSFIFTKPLEEGEMHRIGELIRSSPSTVAFALESLGGAVYDVGEFDTAFIHRAGRLAVGQSNFFPVHGNDTANEEGLAWQNQLFELVDEIYHPLHESYLNYVSKDLDHPLERYYGANLPRLVQVKKNYDPENYFYNPQSIPVTLPEGFKMKSI